MRRRMVKLLGIILAVSVVIYPAAVYATDEPEAECVVEEAYENEEVAEPIPDEELPLEEEEPETVEEMEETEVLQMDPSEEIEEVPEETTPEDGSEEEDDEEEDGSNEDLLATVHLSDLPDLPRDWRMTQIDAIKSMAKRKGVVLEEKREGAKVVGHFKAGNAVYVLEDLNDGWIYLESGRVRGFGRREDFADRQEEEKERERLIREDVAKGQMPDLSRFTGTASPDVPWTENTAFLYTHTTGEAVLAEKVYGLANDTAFMKEEQSEASRTVAEVPARGLVFLLQDEGDWCYVESGNTKGFVRKDAIRSGKEVDAEVSGREEEFSQAETNVDPMENRALYETFTSVKREQQLHPDRERILDLAASAIGCPYVWGGTDLYQGCDCSGFVQRIYGTFGYVLPRVAEAQAYAGVQIPCEKALPGDLIFYARKGKIYHVAIYAGDGKTIEAYGEDEGIIMANAFGRDEIWAVRVIRD